MAIAPAKPVAPQRVVPDPPGLTLRPGWSAAALALAAGGLAVWLLVASVIHLTQGIASVGLADAWALLTGQATDQAAAVIAESRLPRLAAAVVVGAALGASGATMQGVARNPLASPDTTAVNAGAYLALTVVAALGLSTGILTGAAVAFLGGLAAAALVIALASGSDASAIRLVLAGSVITLGISSITSVLLLLFPWQTQGMFAWGAGSLSQNGSAAVRQILPVVVIALLVLVVLGRRLDLLQLGDEAARTLGMAVGRTRAMFVVLAVLLAACAVTVAGPIGFIGLCAPVLMRLVARWVRPMRRHRVLIVMSAVAGIALVLSADVAMRMIFGSEQAVSLPTGVVTTILGAAFLIVLAQTIRTGMMGDSLVTMRSGTRLGRRHPWLLCGFGLVVLAGIAIAGLLLGDRIVLLGDVANWLRGVASLQLEIVLDTRAPRVGAALLAGMCLALAGALVQNVTRNPLADPGILGVTHGAGLGAVVAIVTQGTSSFFGLLTGGLIGATVAALIVFGLSARDGMDQARMVLVGVGTGAAASAITTLLLVRTDPWSQNKGITWLGGSTYGAQPYQLIPMLVVLGVTAVVLMRTKSDLDLLQFDETTPRVLGIAVGRSRMLHISIAVVLTAVATASVGVIAFVGLVAPHAARILIGKRHAYMLPLTAITGAALVCLADAVGRFAIAPGQLPAGLVTALIGTPYFLWFLWRMRADR